MLEILKNPKIIIYNIDGLEFGVTIQDFNQFNRINVFYNSKRIGFKDYPPKTDITNGVIEYSIRKIGTEKLNGLYNKIPKI